MGVEFDKSKTAGGFSVTIETHNDTFDAAAGGKGRNATEHLIDLFLGGVE